MSDIAISVEGIGKMYRLAHEAQRSGSFRELITNTALGPFRRLKALRGEATADTEEFWALRDVSFQVPRGQVVGIIGRNGAGKSTLLKVLSRIVEPTEGRAVMHGRVASLLEVGTGFHPELTGRENIYLNGSILGMRKREIDRKFDEIVAFAEVEKFLDTPVKRYSSGMYVRLAFAVAAHLDPEILIVDEVLAVGDAEFQKKCIGKMQDVARGGQRTVLFVSHNMAAIRALCTMGVVLSRGSVQYVGDVPSSTAKYLSQAGSSASAGWTESETDTQRRRRPMRFVEASCQLLGRQPEHELAVTVGIQSTGETRPAFMAIDILDASGTGVMQAIPDLTPFITCPHGRDNFEVRIKLPPLVPGPYSLTLWVGPHNTTTYDEVKSVLSFEITESPQPERSFPHTADHGWIVPHSSVHRAATTAATTD